MYGTSQTIRNNLASTTELERAQQPGAHAARAIEIAAQLSPGERNIMNQSGQLPPIHADQARQDGFDDFLLASLVREQLAYLTPLREAEIRKIGDRYAPLRRENGDRLGNRLRTPYNPRRSDREG